LKDVRNNERRTAPVFCVGHAMRLIARNDNIQRAWLKLLGPHTALPMVSSSSPELR
jgi:hypothetical protein